VHVLVLPSGRVTTFVDVPSAFVVVSVTVLSRVVVVTVLSPAVTMTIVPMGTSSTGAFDSDVLVPQMASFMKVADSTG
jgi:hypothetical protein